MYQRSVSPHRSHTDRTTPSPMNSINVVTASTTLMFTIKSPGHNKGSLRKYSDFWVVVQFEVARG